jgi:hypothetical protein
MYFFLFMFIIDFVYQTLAFLSITCVILTNHYKNIKKPAMKIQLAIVLVLAKSLVLAAESSSDCRV